MDRKYLHKLLRKYGISATSDGVTSDSAGSDDEDN
jgi:hypothetical protein